MVRHVTKQQLFGVVVGGSVLCIGLAGCRHGGQTVPLTAPFDERVVVGEVSAVWNSTGEERAFADAVRLKEPQIRFHYRADVRNRSGQKLFVRLGQFDLVDDKMLALGQDAASVDCTLSAGSVEGVLAGDIWVTKGHADKVRGFGLNHFAVPLDDRNRAHYRAFRLQGRPAETADIDAEIARYAAAPPCVSR